MPLPVRLSYAAGLAALLTVAACSLRPRPERGHPRPLRHLARSGPLHRGPRLHPDEPGAEPRATSGPVTVVGLGDSVTAATNCGCTDFVTQLAHTLPSSVGPSGTPVNLGSPGLTTAGLAQQVRSDDRTRRALSAAGVVVVTIGANDLNALVGRWAAGGCPAQCVTPAVDAMGGRLRATLEAIRALLPPGSRLLVTDYWAVFEDGDVAVRLHGAGFPPWQDAVTRSANSAICSAARSVSATCVDLYAPFKGPTADRDDTPLLAADGDHPDAAGEAVITAALRRALA